LTALTDIERETMNEQVTIDTLTASNKVAITRREAADALHVDPRTITAGIQDGSIPSVRLGRRVLIPRIPFLQLFGVMVPSTRDPDAA
jgi:excisionase family DNA binding protein